MNSSRPVFCSILGLTDQSRRTLPCAPVSIFRPHPRNAGRKQISKFVRRRLFERKSPSEPHENSYGIPARPCWAISCARCARPPAPLFEVRFETAPGEQAQVDFAHFKVVFDDEPAVRRVVWLFSMVLGHSRFLFARFCLHQDLQTLLRLHIEPSSTSMGCHARSSTIA